MNNTMDDIQEKAKAWLKIFHPSYSPMQEEIYLSWLERVKIFSQQRGLTVDEDFLLEKTLSYFFPKLFLLRSPFLLPDISKAVDIVRRVYEQKSSERIVIYGDRDADGVTSSAILYLFLTENLKLQNVVVLTPQEDEKYGITQEVAERILQSQPDILFTLDCGSLNKDTLAYIKENIPHMETVVMDHHNIPNEEENYPQVEAFINAKRLPATHSEHDLCTAGLAYKFIHALTYSFTKFYNVPTLIKDDTTNVVMMNGVMQEPINSRAEYDSATFARTMDFSTNRLQDEENIWNAKMLWEEELKKNRSLFKFADFCKQANKQLSAVEKYNILENISIPALSNNVYSYLPYAMIGTVADLMPLLEDNRILVSEGIFRIRNFPKQTPVALRELLKSLQLNYSSFDEQNISFHVSPTINAAGRLGKSQAALDVLLENDPLEAAKKSKELRSINKERKALTAKAMQLIEENLDDVHQDFPIIIVHHAEIHRGISGLVAGKIAEQFEKPAVVLVDDGESIRGSVRSHQNENVFRLLESVGDLLIQFGGHRQAAGFSLAYEKRDVFMDTLYQKSKEISLVDGENFSSNDFISTQTIYDYKIEERLWQDVSLFAPYGQMNPHPLLCIEPTSKVEVEWIGKEKSHARLNFTANKRGLVEAVWFFPPLKKMDLDVLHKNYFFAEPHINTFLGKMKFQLRITSAQKIPHETREEFEEQEQEVF